MNSNELYNYLQLVAEGKEKEAYELCSKDVPEVLRTYINLDDKDATSNQKKFSTLRNNELWFASTSTLNDPYELQGFYFDKEKLESGRLRNYVDKIDTIWDGYGLICFTSCSVDFLPMWAYYANNHKGFCVEFEVYNKAAIHKVFYENSRRDMTVFFEKLIDAGIDAHEKGLQNTPETKALTALMTQNFYFKSRDWSHEKEYRIVQTIHNNKGERLPLSRFGLKTARIVAGMNCSEDSIRELNSISNELKCGNVWCSKKSDSRFGIELYQYDS